MKNQTQIKGPYEDAIKYGFILILVIIGVIILNKIAKALSSNSEIKQGNKEINKYELSWSNADFERFANQLEDAFNGWGTKDEIVVRVIKKLNNSSDWYALSNAFGVREIDRAVFGKIEGNLTELLQHDLEDNDEYDEIYDHLNQIGVSI